MLYHALLGVISISPIFQSLSLECMNFMDLIMHAMLQSYTIKSIKIKKLLKYNPNF